MDPNAKTSTMYSMKAFQPGTLLEIARLMRQHSYYRECKLPALEKQLEWVKKRISACATGEGADAWLVKEFGDLSRAVEDLRCEMAYIAARAENLGGLSERVADRASLAAAK